MTQRQEDRMSKGMVRSTIRMLIPLNKQSEALEIWRSVKVRTQFKPGCISTRLYLGVDEARAIMIEELWTSEEDTYVICNRRNTVGFFSWSRWLKNARKSDSTRSDTRAGLKP